MFMNMKVKVINRSHHPLPEYATTASAGLDLRANLDSPVTLQPLERKLIPTGLYIALPEGCEAQIRPRSGLALKHGISLLNTPGTIDADYRGEIRIALHNHSKYEQSIEPGERVAQLVIAPYLAAEFEECEELSDTCRGEGGFGSTGKG